tara:strand:+ start:302 stop:670 length:369 start_codon:yes stop_codon:yes gene_type:complete
MKIKEIAKTIKDITEVDILQKSRKREIVELRSVATYYMREVSGLKLRQITEDYKKNGLKIHHATLLHSLKNYDVYMKYNDMVKKAHLCLIDDNLVTARKYILKNMSKMTAEHITKIEAVLQD